MKLFKRRRLNTIYFIIMILVIGASLYFNIKLHEVETTTCLVAGGGNCNDLETFLLYEMLAYGFLLIAVIMLIYTYLFHKREPKQNNEVSETTVNENAIVDSNITNVRVIQMEQKSKQSSKAVEEKTETVVVRYKKDVVKHLTKEMKISKYKADKLINIIFDSIKEELIENQRVDIAGFGTFVKYKVDDYDGVNPLTGEKIKVESHNRIKFAPSKNFKQLFDGQEPTFLKKYYTPDRRDSSRGKIKEL